MQKIFVFGSNKAGRHGKGAALHAKQHCGAIYGQGEGLQGSSYAIPTKDEHIQTLPLYAIAEAVNRFKAFAASRPDLTFEVTPIGCGLAGYLHEQIAPMFYGAPPNCALPEAFLDVLSRVVVQDTDENEEEDRPTRAQFREDYTDAYLARLAPEVVEMMWAAYCHGYARRARKA